jgi:AraC-like DNA-binding protein
MCLPHFDLQQTQSATLWCMQEFTVIWVGGSWELLLRTWGVSLSLLIALAIGGAYRASSPWQVLLAPVLTFVAWASYLACSGAGDVCGVLQGPSHLGSLILALNLAFPFILWLLSRQLLSDTLRVPFWAWLVLSLLLLSGMLGVWHWNDVAWAAARVLQKICAYVFVLMALWQVWRGGQDDLIEQRRQLRRRILLLAGLYSAGVLSAEIWLGHEPAPIWLIALHLLVMDLALLGLALWLLRPTSAFLAWVHEPPIVQSAESTHDGSLDPEPREFTGPSRTPRHDIAALAGRVHAQMISERWFADSALSLASLSKQLHVPEYVLRRAIHEGLGQRNFPAFVNRYRLDEVARQLLDPAQDRLPILTLALEAGFGSIGPFNRAFRERFECSPSQYRLSRST